VKGGDAGEQEGDRDPENWGRRILSTLLYGVRRKAVVVKKRNSKPTMNRAMPRVLIFAPFRSVAADHLRRTAVSCGATRKVRPARTLIDDVR